MNDDVNMRWVRRQLRFLTGQLFTMTWNAVVLLAIITLEFLAVLTVAVALAWERLKRGLQGTGLFFLGGFILVGLMLVVRSLPDTTTPLTQSVWHGCPDGGVCGAILNTSSGTCSGQVDDAGACRTIFLATIPPEDHPDLLVTWRVVDNASTVALLTLNQWDGGRWSVGWNHALCAATVDGGLVCGGGP